MNRAALICLLALGACTLQDRAAIARTVADSLDALDAQIDTVMSQAGSIVDQIASSLDC
jgi:hypothetical protein